MAAQNLPSLSAPLFPQLHRGTLVQNLLELVTLELQFAPTQFSPCEYEYEHCLCGRDATVTDLESERQLCGKHFREQR